jgi:mannose-1-phosphate guanylyltransferase
VTTRKKATPLSLSSLRHVWAIVLAAGDGQRVSAWTTNESGQAVPKQYCSFGRQRSMLRWALERASNVVPKQNVVTVVAEQHRRFWELELSDFPAENVIVQPRNRGTATGILLALVHVLLRSDETARILVLPSDHYVEDEETLRRTLAAALEAPRHKENRLVLLGMTTRDFDPEYGWIVPAPGSLGEMRDVVRFVEKPDCGTARDLSKSGALVNSLILVTESSVILQLYQETHPGILRLFIDCFSEKTRCGSIDDLYDLISASDFSRDVLERSAHRLSVLVVPECGWSDLGTPARIQVFMNGRDARERRTLEKAVHPPTLSLETGRVVA